LAKLKNFTNHQTDNKLFCIAVGMGATVSISEFAHTSNWIISLATGNRFLPVDITASMMLLLQHCIISGLLKRVYKIFSCKKELALTC